MIDVIPAIDIMDGACVRLTQGDFARKKVYYEDPLEIAKQFEQVGIKNLHLVDLDGARTGTIVNHQTLRAISSNTTMKIDFGGGIRSEADLKLAFECGASQITGGSIAVKNKPLFKTWLEDFGSERIILGADVKGANVAISGWQDKTAINLDSFLTEYLGYGVQYVICTDISKDGVLQGPAFELYQEIQGKFPEVKLIASGGVSSIADIEKLDSLNIFGVIVGKAFYEGKISLDELGALIC